MTLFFCCEEEHDEYEAEARNITKVYYDKLSDIVEFMLRDRLLDFYGNDISELDADSIAVLMDKL